jgi:hemolysin III
MHTGGKGGKILTETCTFTRREELANAVTHGIGAVLSLAALVLLVLFAAVKGTPLHVFSFTVFGIAMLLVYTASTLVHSLPEGRAKRWAEIADYACIYLFIAGTYTPVVLHAVQGALGWTLLGIVWTAAVLGIAFQSLFPGRYPVVSTLLYLATGWIIVAAWGPMTERMAAEGLVLLVLGGAAYTVGTVFFLWRRLKYHHAVWHLLVLAGSALHFCAILFYLLP